MIASIEKLQPLKTANPISADELKNIDAGGENLFADIFRTAIDGVKETDAEKTQAEYLLATGQLDNPAALTIASTKYEMSVELLVQIRNKALDAYSELTRINL